LCERRVIHFRAGEWADFFPDFEIVGCNREQLPPEELPPDDEDRAALSEDPAAQPQ